MTINLSADAVQRLLLQLQSDSDFVELTVRKVHTAEGSKFYGLPIGAPITRDLAEKAKRAGRLITGEKPSSSTRKPESSTGPANTPKMKTFTVNGSSFNLPEDTKFYQISDIPNSAKFFKRGSSWLAVSSKGSLNALTEEKSASLDEVLTEADPYLKPYSAPSSNIPEEKPSPSLAASKKATEARPAAEKKPTARSKTSATAKKEPVKIVNDTLAEADFNRVVNNELATVSINGTPFLLSLTLDKHGNTTVVGRKWIKTTQKFSNVSTPVNPAFFPVLGSKNYDDAAENLRNLLSPKKEEAAAPDSGITPEVGPNDIPEDLHVKVPTPSLEDAKFEILEDSGTSGDGYSSAGLWGKYGAAGVLIRNVDADKETFLIVQRGKGQFNREGIWKPMSNADKWQLPGGALNSKEDPYQGTARETSEELQASKDYLASLQPVGTTVFTHPTGWEYTNIAADASSTFEPVVDGTETAAAKWVTRDELAKMKADGELHPALAKSIDEVLSHFVKPEKVSPATYNNPFSPVAPVSPPIAVAKEAVEVLKQKLATGSKPIKRTTIPRKPKLSSYEIEDAPTGTVVKVKGKNVKFTKISDGEWSPNSLPDLSLPNESMFHLSLELDGPVREEPKSQDFTEKMLNDLPVGAKLVSDTGFEQLKTSAGWSSQSTGGSWTTEGLVKIVNKSASLGHPYVVKLPEVDNSSVSMPAPAVEVQSVVEASVEQNSIRPSLATATVEFGGISLSAAQVQQAITILESTPGVKVKSSLKKWNHPLGEIEPKSVVGTDYIKTSSLAAGVHKAAVGHLKAQYLKLLKKALTEVRTKDADPERELAALAREPHVKAALGLSLAEGDSIHTLDALKSLPVGSTVNASKTGASAEITEVGLKFASAGVWPFDKLQDNFPNPFFVVSIPKVDVEEDAPVDEANLKVGDLVKGPAALSILESFATGTQIKLDTVSGQVLMKNEKGKWDNSSAVPASSAVVSHYPFIIVSLPTPTEELNLNDGDVFNLKDVGKLPTGSLFTVDGTNTTVPIFYKKTSATAFIKTSERNPFVYSVSSFTESTLKAKFHVEKEKTAERSSTNFVGKRLRSVNDFYATPVGTEFESEAGVEWTKTSDSEMTSEFGGVYDVEDFTDSGWADLSISRLPEERTQDRISISYSHGKHSIAPGLYTNKLGKIKIRVDDEGKGFYIDKTGKESSISPASTLQYYEKGYSLPVDGSSSVSTATSKSGELPSGVTLWNSESGVFYSPDEASNVHLKKALQKSYEDGVLGDSEKNTILSSTGSIPDVVYVLGQPVTLTNLNKIVNYLNLPYPDNSYPPATPHLASVYGMNYPMSAAPEEFKTALFLVDGRVKMAQALAKPSSAPKSPKTNNKLEALILEAFGNKDGSPGLSIPAPRNYSDWTPKNFPKSTYSMSLPKQISIVKKYFAEKGITVGSYTGHMSDTKKHAWLSAAKKLNFHAMWELELAANNGSHGKSKVHPGNPENYTDGQIPKAFKEAPLLPEIFDTGQVPGYGSGEKTPPHLSEHYLSNEMIADYVKATKFPYWNYVSMHNLKKWALAHSAGDIEGQTYSVQVGKQNSSDGYTIGNEEYFIDPQLASEPLSDANLALFDFGLFNVEANRAPLAKHSLDSYLRPFFSKNEWSHLSAKLSDDQMSALVQLHWLGHHAPVTSKNYTTPAQAKKIFEDAVSTLKTQMYADEILGIEGVDPKKILFKKSNSQPSFGGMQSKFQVEDIDTGTKYLFKIAQEAFRAEVEHAALKVSKVFGFSAPDSHLVTVDDVYGQAQRLMESSGDLFHVSPTGLSRKQLSQVAQEHLLDWVLDNDDSHGGNFIISTSSNVYGIDKGRAWAKTGKTVLDLNHLIAPDHSKTYYKNIYDAISAGSLNDDDVDSVYRSVIRRAGRMQKVDDEELRPIILEGLKNRTNYSTTSATDASSLVDLILAKKNSLVSDFEKLWDEIFAKAGRPKPPLKEPVVLPSAGFSEETITKAKASGAQGMPIFFAGTDIEDAHLMVQYARKDAASFVHTVEEKVTVLNEMPNGSEVFAGKTKYTKNGNGIWVDPYVNEVSVNALAKSNNLTGIPAKDVPSSGKYVVTAQGTMREEADSKLVTWFKQLGVKAYSYGHSSKSASVSKNYDLAPNNAISASNVYEALLAAAKTVNHHQADGQYNAETMNKLSQTIVKIEEALKQENLFPADPLEEETYKDVMSKYLKTAQDIQTAQREKEAAPIIQQLQVEKPKVELPKLENSNFTATSRESVLYNGLLDPATGELVDLGTTRKEGTSGIEYVITTPEFEISYIPWNTSRSNIYKSHQGDFRIRVFDDEDVAGKMQRAQDILSQSGLNFEAPEELDHHLFYWRQMFGVSQHRKPSPETKKLNEEYKKEMLGKTFSKEDELSAWQKIWSVAIGSEAVGAVEEDRKYLPEVSKLQLEFDQPSGSPSWQRPDIPEDFWENQALPYHSLTGGYQSNDEALLNIIKTGALLSTEERNRVLGKWVGGMSSSSDQGYGSADYIFVRQSSYKKIANSSGVYFHPRVLTRTTTYSYIDDKFGNLEYRQGHAPFDLEEVSNLKKGSSNETMVKNSLSMFFDVAMMLFESEVSRQQALAYFREHNIEEINGIPLEVFFPKYGEGQMAYDQILEVIKNAGKED